MFDKILIANRGEIAVRIALTCRSMGISTVAVYSEPDAHALHVQVADEAYLIGPATASQSYLSVAAVLNAAHRSRAEAIHPGYGFLSENAEFARAVVEAGLCWIGPPPAVIALMGDKVAAKERARAAGLPVIADYAGDDQSLLRLHAEAETIGYPVMIKAAAGGGGRGMRVVRNADDLEQSLDSAKREALAAFADDRIFLEKLVERARHIEVQVLSDRHGNHLCLGERECSIQRRHQKVIEETPCPVLTRDLRQRMQEDAMRLARNVDYVSAGTVEFLFHDDAYFFLEMNTRIQVEHPVTEMVTGVDLVAMQIQIAAGLPLLLRQSELNSRGHAIEVRLYAEDPANGFLPSTGTLSVFRPPEGPGIRNDVGVFEGDTVSPHYDPMLAKLIVHAPDRVAARERLRSALEHYGILGIRTNVDFLHWILQQDAFVFARADTGFLEHHHPQEERRKLDSVVVMAAAAHEILLGESPSSNRLASHSNGFNPWRDASSWRGTAVPRTFAYEWRGAPVTVSALRLDNGMWRCHVGDVTEDVRIYRPSEGVIVLVRDQQIARCFVGTLTEGIQVMHGAQSFTLQYPQIRQETAGLSATGMSSSSSLTTPMPGTVVKILVTAGQVVAAQEQLVVLEAMKMEHIIRAPRAGTVGDILYREGDLVPEGASVVRLEEV